MTTPRVGGTVKYGTVDYHWTGGGLRPDMMMVAPWITKAFRPSDWKGQVKMEESCTANLPASHHLSTPDKVISDPKAVSFKTWIDRIRSEAEDRGMDTVFRMQDVTTGHETYILDSFGRANTTQVAAWVEMIQTGGGALNAQLTAAPCPYDLNNLVMSAKMIRNSLDIDMLKKVEDDIHATASGPQVFAAVVNIHQALSSSAVRVLIGELQELSLAKEPGENVETFAAKVCDIAKRIQGTGPETCPRDLPSLVYQCFLGSATQLFQGEVVLIFNRSDRNDPTDPGIRNWDARVADFKAQYRNLKTRKLWEADKYHKEKAEAQALKATVAHLQQQLAGTKTSGGTDSRTCFHCGKSGHIKPDCPDKDKPKADGAGAPGGAGTTTGGSSRKTAPKEGEPHTKTVDKEVWKWCGVCKRWNKGADKAHLTEEHVKGKGKATEGAPAANNAVAEVAEPVVAALATNDTGPSLRLVSGYLSSIGRPVNPSKLTYCLECDYFVNTDDVHNKTIAHSCSKCEVSMRGVQRTIEEAAEWVVVKGRKVRALSKDLASQR